MSIPILMDMDMGDMGDDMSSNSTSMTTTSCEISMLFNYNTIDACFLSSSWHIRSKGMFAGTIIGIFCLCILIEFVRRAGREYDRYLMRRAGIEAGCGVEQSVPEFDKSRAVRGAVPHFPSWPHQVLRGFIYGSQFTGAFMVMLLGMYFNVIVLIFIFLGQTVGYILFGRDTVSSTLDHAGSGHCC